MALYSGMPRKRLWQIVRSQCDNYAYLFNRPIHKIGITAEELKELQVVQEWLKRFGPRKMNNTIRYYKRFYRLATRKGKR